MARTYYHGRTEANAVAYDAQVKREEFWGPILDGVANLGAFVAFVVYVALGLACVAGVLFLAYMGVGGLLGVFGVEIFPVGFFNG